MSPPLDAVGLVVVSPNRELRYDVAARLQSGRWLVAQATSGAEALEKVESGEVSLILLDAALPDLRVDEFKELLQAEYPQVEIVPIHPHTGQPIIGTPSPQSISFELLRHMNRTPLAPLRATPERSEESAEAAPVLYLPGLVGTSEPMQRVCSMARLVSQRDTTVLITGESGTGKDLVARALHQLSPRRYKPFVVINCAAIPEPLLEAELFGYVKGAFTGAVQSRIGRIHAAQGGTLFLDEIGDLPLGLQSKLLRFLEHGELQRLGTTDTFSVDVRVIAATNADLRKVVQERGFRDDLFYRLSIFPIELPPLRDRMSDLPGLAQTFLGKFCPQPVTLSPEAESLLMQHSWPGNVRELRNVIERATILAGSEHTIRPEHIVL
jgi:transcriptional regulator with GAF, ATPase, and Fis domain